MSNTTRGRKDQPAQPRYEGRDTRSIRRAQHALFFAKGRALTFEEKGAIRFLSNRQTRDES